MMLRASEAVRLNGGAFGFRAVKPDSTEPYYRARITIDDVRLHAVPAGFRIVLACPSPPT
jgi:hypothetical protein